MFWHHKLLFLRLLSLVGSSFSLFKGVTLLGITREQSPWCSPLPVAVDASSSVPQQRPGTGNPSMVNVWVWNWGKLANRLLTASCSSRLFLCSGGPSPVAADTLNSSMKPWTKMCRITRFCCQDSDLFSSRPASSLPAFYAELRCLPAVFPQVARFLPHLSTLSNKHERNIEMSAFTHGLRAHQSPVWPAAQTAESHSSCSLHWLPSGAHLGRRI